MGLSLKLIRRFSQERRVGWTGSPCAIRLIPQQARQAIAAGNRATWAMSIGAVGLGAAAALFWLVPTGDENELTVVPSADREGASLYVNGMF